jgi:hypothetical protein
VNFPITGDNLLQGPHIAVHEDDVGHRQRIACPLRNTLSAKLLHQWREEIVRVSALLVDKVEEEDEAIEDTRNTLNWLCDFYGCG